MYHGGDLGDDTEPNGTLIRADYIPVARGPVRGDDGTDAVLNELFLWDNN